jgi:hypothetical protein
MLGGSFEWWYSGTCTDSVEVAEVPCPENAQRVPRDEPVVPQGVVER